MYLLIFIALINIICRSICDTQWGNRGAVIFPDKSTI